MREDGQDPTPIVGGLDLSPVPPWERRRQLLEHFDGLGQGETLRLTGGRELETLHQTLAAERPGRFHWEWAERGPERWTAYVARLPAGSLYTLGGLEPPGTA
ncbi:MAG TPA: DUF2249 domain-containing protein [Dehalococcoidia bacterium]